MHADRTGAVSATRARFSVIVPAYNAAATLSDCLSSILSSNNPLEVIVVDDGSVDNTADIARTFPDVRLIRTSNHGAAHARNVGIEACHGEYLVFLDADDRWLKGRLHGVLKPFVAHEDVEIVCCDFIKTRDGRHTVRGFEQHSDAMPTARRHKDNILVWDNPFQALCRSLFVCTSTAVVRTATARRLGGFDERFPIAEDMDLWLALAREGRVAALDRVLVEKRETRGSLGSDPDRVLACTDAMLASFSQRRGPLTAAQTKSLRRRRAELSCTIAYHARSRGDRLSACRSYVRSLRLAPSRRAVRGLAASIARKVSIRAP